MRSALHLLAALVFVTALGTPAHAQMSEAALADRAAETIRQYGHFGIFDHVEVAVTDRVVTLTGRVTMPFKRDEIGDRVAKIDGVARVKNDIGVLPASTIDADLRVRIARAIYQNPTFWHYASMANPPIHIIVERGRVTLVGFVNNEVERRLASTLAQVDGAFSVTNRLKVDRE